MRHLIGVVLALVMLAAAFFGGGWGITRMTALSKSGTSLTSIHGLTALAVLLAVGLLLGILMAAPGISPLAAGLPGLVFLGWTALLGASASRAVRLIPMKGHLYGAGFHVLLVSGVLVLLGAAMVIPMFVPSRWRSAARGEDEDQEPNLPAPTGLLS